MIRQPRIGGDPDYSLSQAAWNKKNSRSLPVEECPIIEIYRSRKDAPLTAAEVLEKAKEAGCRREEGRARKEAENQSSVLASCIRAGSFPTLP